MNDNQMSIMVLCVSWALWRQTCVHDDIYNITGARWIPHIAAPNIVAHNSAAYNGTIQGMCDVRRSPKVLVIEYALPLHFWLHVMDLVALDVLGRGVAWEMNRKLGTSLYLVDIVLQVLHGDCARALMYLSFRTWTSRGEWIKESMGGKNTVLGCVVQWRVWTWLSGLVV